jgi:hypothetical protein
LISNFVRFAIILAILLVTAVFKLSTNVSTKLVINQMAIDANRAIQRDVPQFQTHLQALLKSEGVESGLLNGTEAEQQQILRQLQQTIPPFYRSILLVHKDDSIISSMSDESGELLLQEKTAVAKTFDDQSFNIAAADLPSEEHVISIVVPLLDATGDTVAVLVGRVPEISLVSLIGGLQGVVGQGTGFVVDENQRIIAHPDSSHLLEPWSQPPENGQRRLETDIEIGDTAVDSRAYQSRREDSNARELVYQVTGINPPWTVVVTVPYEVVLEMAWRPRTPVPRGPRAR